MDRRFNLVSFKKKKTPEKVETDDSSLISAAAVLRATLKNPEEVVDSAIKKEFKTNVSPRVDQALNELSAKYNSLRQKLYQSLARDFIKVLDEQDSFIEDKFSEFEDKFNSFIPKVDDVFTDEILNKISSNITSNIRKNLKNDIVDNYTKIITRGIPAKLITDLEKYIDVDKLSIEKYDDTELRNLINTINARVPRTKINGGNVQLKVSANNVTGQSVKEIFFKGIDLTEVNGKKTIDLSPISSAQYKTTITVGSSGADYITDGTADNVQIQAAIDTCVTQGGGTVYIKEGTYYINSRLHLGGNNVTLKGAGKNVTTITFQAGTSETYILVDNGDLSNIQITDITFDAASLAKGHVALQGKLSSVTIRNCVFKNVDETTGTKWPLKIGTVNYQTDTVSSVDTSTDTVSCSLNVPTGSSIHFSTTGTLPAGLSTDLVYYAINVTSTSLKLATTYSGALGGTSDVDITDSGTGNHTIEVSDYDSSRSTDIRILDNDFLNNDPNTFEVVLAVNWEKSWMMRNYFSGNELTLSDEVSFYPSHRNTVYAYNIHEDSDAASFGAKDSEGVKVFGNIFRNKTFSFQAINMRDTVDSEVHHNTFITTVKNNTSSAISIEDTSGPTAYDGWGQHITATKNISIHNNTINGFKYGIQGALSSTNRDLDIKYVYIDDNKLDNTEVPIRFGHTDASVDLKYWFVRRNVILNWTGSNVGAIHVIGNTATPDKVSEIYITDNYVAPRASGSNGSVRSVGATLTEVKRNILLTSGSYGEISTANNGVIIAGYNEAYTAKTAAYTLIKANEGGVVNFTGATTANATLPTSNNTAGDTYTVKNSGTGTITVVGTIDGATNYSLATQYDSVTVVFNGTDWSIKSKN